MIVELILARTRHDVASRLACERLGDVGKSAGTEHVIAAQPVHNRAGIPGKPLVDSIGLPFVSLADPSIQERIVPAQNLGAAVGAAAVENEILEIRIALQENRTNRFLEGTAPG